MGILGLVTAGFSGILALIFGYVARGQIRDRGESGDGLAITGIVLGWIWVVLIVLFTVLIAIGIATSASSGG